MLNLIDHFFMGFGKGIAFGIIVFLPIYFIMNIRMKSKYENKIKVPNEKIEIKVVQEVSDTIKCHQALDLKQRVLVPKLKQAILQGKNLEINLDGGFGYTSVFLEMAFGGLEEHNTGNTLITIISQDEISLVDKIKKLMKLKYD